MRFRTRAGYRVAPRRAVALASIVAAIGLIVPAALVASTPTAPAAVDAAAFEPVVLPDDDSGRIGTRVPSTEQRDDTLDPAPIVEPLAERIAPKGRVAADSLPQPTRRPTVTSSGSSSAAVGVAGARARVVRIALAQLHDRYVSGGTGPDSFDCSGLVRYAYELAGVGDKLGGGHSSSAMLAWGRANGLTSRTGGRPGDVVIYGNGSHAGIYLGNGRIISALNPSQGIRITGLYALGDAFTAFIHTRI